jgi:chitin disaccharide deacetylase
MSEPARRHIVLCADDYGIAPGVSAAIRDLIGRGRLNATSVMVAAPSFGRAEAAALLDQTGTDAAIGLHLTLTGPFHPLTPHYAPTRRGAFLSLAGTFLRGLLGLLRPDRLRQEIAAQFAAFAVAFGRPPDFVDGHRHVHLCPQIAEALLQVVTDAAPNAWVRQCARAAAARKPLSDPKAAILDALSRRFSRLAAVHQVRTNPGFAGSYTFSAGADYKKLFPDFLDGLPDGGVVMCHPGTVDAALKQVDPLTDLREREYAFFSGDAFLQVLAAHGVALAATTTDAGGSVRSR